MNDSNVGMHPDASSNSDIEPDTATQSPTVGMHPGASSNLGSQSYNRKNIRAKFHNYSGGNYFITICTLDKRHCFGEIVDNEMILNPLGQYAFEQLKTLATHYDYVEVPIFVVMPNHIHAIITILGNNEVPRIRTALGVVVGGYKQSVTRYARRNNIQFDWQKRYHDHIIRNERDGNMIAQYIETNPIRWSNDCFNI